MRLITITVFLISLFLFLSVYISPESFSYTGLLPLMIPFFIIANIILLLILIMAKRKIFFIPLIALIIGWKFFGITFQLNENYSDVEGLAVLSYNTHLFNFYQSNEENEDFTKNAVQWVKDHPSDIKCLQEFLQDYTTPAHNAIKELGDNGTYEYSYHM